MNLKTRSLAIFGVFSVLSVVLGAESFATFDQKSDEKKYTFRSDLESLPIELRFEVLRYLTIQELATLSGMSHSWRSVVTAYIGGKAYSLDLRNIVLNERSWMDWLFGKPLAFRKLFLEGGIFHSAKKVIFSHQSFQGNWIQYLSLENFAPTDDGNPRLRVETTTGAIFEYLGKDNEFPELGYGWKDPAGLVWYDPIRDREGSPRKMLYSDALQYCRDRKADLPNSDEFQRLGTFFGAEYDEDDRVKECLPGYKFQVFQSNWAENSWILEKDLEPYLVWHFVNGTGDILFGHFRGASKQVVRCVRR